MGALFLVVALGGLGLLMLSGKGSGFNPKVFDMLPGGRPAYKAPVRDIIIQQLQAKQALPHDEHPTEMFNILQHDTILNPDISAYHALQFLHSQGRDIWTPLTYWLPSKKGTKSSVWMGLEPPPKNKNYALLIAASTPWPPLQGAVAPPVPTDIPPIPNA